MKNKYVLSINLSLIVLMLLMLAPAATRAQVSAYNLSTGVGTYTPLVGGTQPNFNNNRELDAHIPIGFNFYYNGALHSEVTISDRGYIALDDTVLYTTFANLNTGLGASSPFFSTQNQNIISGCGSSSLGYQTLCNIDSGSTLATNVVNPQGFRVGDTIHYTMINLLYSRDVEIVGIHGDTLVMASPSPLAIRGNNNSGDISLVNTKPVTYATIGTAPNRTFVVQYEEVNPSVYSGMVSFQIRLNESDFSVDVVYGNCFFPMQPASNARGYNTIGLRGTTPADFSSITTDSIFNWNAPLLADSIHKVMRSSGTIGQATTTVPVSGRYYRWGPASVPVLCHIGGRAYHDANENCVYDSGDTKLQNHTISIDNGQTITFTDTNGLYYTAVDTGTHLVAQSVLQGPTWAPVCPSTGFYTVVLPTPGDSSLANDFADTVNYCYYPVVDIVTNRQRRCNTMNIYNVSYRNLGIVNAAAAYIEIEFDPEIVPYFSTLPWTSVSGNTYTFQLGTLAPLSHGTFLIRDSVKCSAVMGQAVSARAEIFPHSDCVAASLNWDSSDVEVSGQYFTGSDTLFFFISNVGTGSMSSPSQYRIYEDDILLTAAPFQLPSLGMLTLGLPATGRTLRVEADQLPFFPSLSQPRYFQEMCGTPPYSLGHIATVAQDDDDDYVSIDVKEVTYSFDPNEKLVFPSGVGAQHYINPEDKLKYIVNFQNTGNDTAYTVVVKDTIDVNTVDITTLRPISASHAYTVEIKNNVAIWTFNNINLVDSHTNEPLSHGFLSFEIQQRTNTPGTVINNSAAIYFDDNLPVITNTAFVTIALKQLTTGISKAEVEGTQFDLYPNPAKTELYIHVADFEPTAVMVYDVNGHTVLMQPYSSRLSIAQLSAGMYYMQVSGNGHTAYKKFVKE